MACGQVVPRYRLWLALRERGANPEALERADAIAFCDEQMDAFLADSGLSLSTRRLRKLRRALSRFDPLLPTPADRLGSLDGGKA